MTFHQSSAVSVASLLTAATVLVLGYRLGRTHAAWRDLREARRAVVVTRRLARRHTAGLALSGAAVLVTLFAIGYDLTH